MKATFLRRLICASFAGGALLFGNASEAAVVTDKVPILTYADHTVPTYDNPGGKRIGFISPNVSLVQIKSIRSDGWAYGSYAIADGKRVTRWFEMRELQGYADFKNYTLTIDADRTVYRTSQAAAKLGSVLLNAQATVIGEEGNYLKIIYRVNGGNEWKMGWIEREFSPAYDANNNEPVYDIPSNADDKDSAGGTTVNIYNEINIYPPSDESHQEINHNPQGEVEELEYDKEKESLHIKGWVFDEDDMNSFVKVKIYIGDIGGKTSGIPKIYQITANEERNDGKGKHGFDHTLMLKLNSNETIQPVLVYAMNLENTEGTDQQIGNGYIEIQHAVRGEGNVAIEHPYMNDEHKIKISGWTNLEAVRISAGGSFYDEFCLNNPQYAKRNFEKIYTFPKDVGGAWIEVTASDLSDSLIDSNGKKLFWDSIAVLDGEVSLSYVGESKIQIKGKINPSVEYTPMQVGIGNQVYDYKINTRKGGEFSVECSLSAGMKGTYPFYVDIMEVSNPAHKRRISSGQITIPTSGGAVDIKSDTVAAKVGNSSSGTKKQAGTADNNIVKGVKTINAGWYAISNASSQAALTVNNANNLQQLFGWYTLETTPNGQVRASTVKSVEAYKELSAEAVENYGLNSQRFYVKKHGNFFVITDGCGMGRYLTYEEKTKRLVFSKSPSDAAFWVISLADAEKGYFYIEPKNVAGVWSFDSKLNLQEDDRKASALPKEHLGWYFTIAESPRKGTGDVNGDGKITNVDVLFLSKFLVNVRDITMNFRFNRREADIDGNGVIDNNDFTLLKARAGHG